MTENVSVPLKKVTLQALLEDPDRAGSLIIFSHGSGSSRFSPRNRQVSRRLIQSGFATLLVDLLTDEEDAVYENRFDIPLLTSRLVSVTGFMRHHESYAFASIGYFGASTGAASALRASVAPGNPIGALVSRGGRPDLAAESLEAVKAPTLLIVGGNDLEVLELNERAFGELKCVKKLEVVPGATHLFEEEGTLEQVAGLACAWFEKYLVVKNKET